jgi:hypothetical protein
MTTAPALTLAGPLTLGPSDAGPASGSAAKPPAPVAIAFPPAFRGGEAGVSYEAYARGVAAGGGDLEIVARVVRFVLAAGREARAADPDLLHSHLSLIPSLRAHSNRATTSTT